MARAQAQAIDAILKSTRPPTSVDVSNESKAIFWSSDEPLETIFISKLTCITSDGGGGFLYLDMDGDEYDSCLVIAEQEKPSEATSANNRQFTKSDQCSFINEHTDIFGRAAMEGMPADEPEWITPGPEHVGEMVHVKFDDDYFFSEWHPRKLLAVLKHETKKFVCQNYFRGPHQEPLVEVPGEGRTFRRARIRNPRFAGTKTAPSQAT